MSTEARSDTRLSTALLLTAAAAGAFAATSLLSRPCFSWRNKVVLITGGSRGLGLILARELTARGAKLAICARDRLELARAREDLATRGGDAFAVTCDITDPAGAASLIRTVQSRLGPLDVLINNAGVITMAPVEEMSERDFDQAMRTHFWGPLRTMLAALPAMRRRRTGRIVNICSFGGKVAVPHLAPYCASKFALAGVSEALREEFYRYGIRITTIFPGLMQTGSPANATFKGNHRAEYAWFALASSTPGLVMNARRAARKILRAAEQGRGEAILGLPAKLAVLARTAFPETWMRAMSEINRVLPTPGGHSPAGAPAARAAKGKQSHSRLVPSILTRPVYQAAKRNNQLTPAAAGSL